MARKDERIAVLKVEIEEQRRDFDFLERLAERAGLKNITYLTASLVLLGYLYTGNEQTNLRTKLFIPNEPYGVIIYALAFLLFISAIAMLLMALKPRTWFTAYDNDQEDILTEDEERYLKYMKKRYVVCSKNNAASYGKKQALLEMSFPPLVLGGILLLLLKTFGG